MDKRSFAGYADTTVLCTVLQLGSYPLHQNEEALAMKISLCDSKILHEPVYYDK